MTQRTQVWLYRPDLYILCLLVTIHRIQRRDPHEGRHHSAQHKKRPLCWTLLMRDDERKVDTQWDFAWTSRRPPDPRNPLTSLVRITWYTRIFRIGVKWNLWMTYLSTNRLSGTLNSDLTLSAFFVIPFIKQVRIVSFTLWPKNDTAPCVSRSSVCCVANSRTLSSINYEGNEDSTQISSLIAYLGIETAVFIFWEELLGRFHRCNPRNRILYS